MVTLIISNNSRYKRVIRSYQKSPRSWYRNLMTIIEDFYHMGLKYNVSYNGDITNKYGW
jgi:hypothetical protein